MGKTSLKVGDTFQSTSGNTYSIIELLSEGECRVRFNDEFKYEVVAENHAVRSGRLKNPYYGKLFGKGYLGVGPYKSKLGPTSQGYSNTREYMTWINMLSRCYYERYTHRNTGNKVYNDAEICDEWLNFQIFAEWFTLRYNAVQLIDSNIKVSLDKDILGNSSKLYSPETCCLIPVSLNSTMITWTSIWNRKDKSNYKLIKNGTYSLRLYFHDGTTRTIRNIESKEECTEIYMEHKRLRLRELAEKYKHLLELKVYNKLIRI